MKRRGFAVLLASLAGCASNARERTDEPTEITETPEKTETETESYTETTEITDSPEYFEDILVEYLSFDTAEYLKYRKKDGGTAKLHPQYDIFAQPSATITNESDHSIDWYGDSKVWINAEGRSFTPILGFEEVKRNRQFDVSNLSGWDINGIQGEPISQVIDPGETAMFYPLFDIVAGEETLHWEFRGTTITLDPIA